MGTLIFHKLADRSGPEPPEGEAWPLAGVVVVGDPRDEHDFPEDFVVRAVADGWVTASRGHLIFHLRDGDLDYEILRPPGRYVDDGGVLKETDVIDDPTVQVLHDFQCRLTEGGPDVGH